MSCQMKRKQVCVCFFVCTSSILFLNSKQRICVAGRNAKKYYVKAKENKFTVTLSKIVDIKQSQVLLRLITEQEERQRINYNNINNNGLIS